MTILTDRPEQSRSEALASIFELTRSVANAARPDEIYEAALLCLRESLGVEKSSILLFDRDGIMRFKAWLGLSPEYRRAVEGHSPWTRDTKDPEPVLVSDVAHEPSLEGLLEPIKEEGITALAFIPLVVSGRLTGKFMLYFPDEHDFTDHEILFSQTIAAQVAFA